VLSTQVDTITNNGLTWLNIERPSREALMEILGKYYHFHELNLEDCLSKIQIPKIDRYSDHIFVILQFPTTSRSSLPSSSTIITTKNTAKKDSPTTLRVSQLSVFMGRNFLVTVHQGDLQPLNELFQLCKKESDSNSSSSQKDELMGKSSGYLLHTIIDTLVDDLLHRLMKIVGNLQDIEDAVFDNKVGVVKEISLLRREITTLRRIVFPLKRIVSEITNRDIQRFSEEDLTKYFNDVEDHINKVLEVLESSNETIEIYKDTDFMLSTEKTNQTLAILTIVFTLSIPATVIGTFYGMNVNIPGGLETGQWTFFGTYTTLIIVLIISATFALLMYWYFRKVGWITGSSININSNKR
jgi:magnesium transporter